ncbi:MAG: disulfide bond formation protein DsbA [Comamonadaceae bacterium]|nr:MAG: disulfide bond formation protein DsbA [Comamonadaceae bacterium]
MKQRNIFIASAALLIIAFAVGAFFYKNQQAEQAAQIAKQNQMALVRAHAPNFGNADAPVHIVEFFDPACGTCAQFYPMVKQLMAEHPGKIRLSVRYAPFHPGSDQVVKVIEAARKQGQFRQALEALFASQHIWVQNHTAQVDLIWAPLSSLGLDMERLKSDMNSPEVAQLIQQDLADAKTMNVTMTPEFFVNGKPLPNFGFDELKKLVEDALLSANAK